MDGMGNEKDSTNSPTSPAASPTPQKNTNDDTLNKDMTKKFLKMHRFLK